MHSTHALIFGGKTWCRNFETRSMLDCHCYGQQSHKNESRTEIRRKPLIWAVFVLDKTCLYKWCSSRLIFPRINGLNVTDKLDCMSVASAQWLVLAVVNSSDWDTDYHTQSLQWLGQRDTENEGTLQQCMGHNSWQLAWHSEGHIGRVDTVERLQQWSGHPVPQLKLQWPGKPTASWDSETL